MPIASKFLEDMKKALTNFVFIDVDSAEADDVIAVLAKTIGKDYKESIVISNDGDYVQLLAESNLKLFNPMKRQFVKSLNSKTAMLVKVLSGDKSDNIPNLRKGLGEKTAAKIIRDGLEDYLTENKLTKEYERNTKLVDWNYIPKPIVKNIKIIYSKYETKPLNSTKLLMFFSTLNNKKLTETYSLYSKLLGGVK
jgi:5'-3' exonuclease